MLQKIRYRIHSDDYGVSLHASKQIRSLIEDGILDSVSIMVNMMDAAPCAYQLLPYKNKIKISLHLNVLEGICCSDPALIPGLVHKDGTFRLGWGSLLWKSCFPRFRSELKTEINAQFQAYYHLMKLRKDEKIRVDSHQHFHMIPMVFSSLCKVIEENNYNIEYIRVVREPIVPHLKIGFGSVLRFPVNCLKNFICNSFCMFNYFLSENVPFSSGYYIGLIYSNHMNADRVCRVLKNIRQSNLKNREIEITFHPGRMLNEEAKEKHSNINFLRWHLSPNRDVERKECTLLAIELKGIDKKETEDDSRINTTLSNYI